jgi:hypothetical protein
MEAILIRFEVEVFYQQFEISKKTRYQQQNNAYVKHTCRSLSVRRVDTHANIMICR